MQLTLLNAQNTILATSKRSGYGIALVYEHEYREGDHIHITVEEQGLYYIQLDEVLSKQVVYLKGQASFIIPVAETRLTCYHSSAFRSNMHLLTLEKAYGLGKRNLALNPYDHHFTTNIYPHASANVETRGEMVFAARNAIDGILANAGHGLYPYASWGINQDPTAELHLDFGHSVLIDEVRLTLRADWPHDSWWTEATIIDSDGEVTTLALEKLETPQRFLMKQKKVTSLTLCNLKKADDSSPFPALTQIEVWGYDL